MQTPKQLVVDSPYPNLRGNYAESGTNEGRAAFVRLPSNGGGAWIFYSARFGTAPCWYFGNSLPSGGSLSSLCCSLDAAETPEASQWPPADIISVGVQGVPGHTAEPSQQAAQARPLPAAMCSECRELKQLNDGLCCSKCAPGVDSLALDALSLLRTHASNATLKKLAWALAAGHAEVRETLEVVAAAHENQDERPLILDQPATALQVGAGTTSLICEAISFGCNKLQYQWDKDGFPLRRAERSRLVLSGAGPQDEGSYVCRVSAGRATACTRPCEVKLSEEAQKARAAESAKRSRFESPLRRAAEAVRLGQKEIAVTMLTEALEAAEDNEAAQVDALCRRTELQFQLGRWKEAFQDASAAVTINPSISRAHAARGAAAEKLGFLAEAASSWETAELLGGVPEAAKQAEMCRERLQQFFAANESNRESAAGTGNQAEDAEGNWRRNGWQGRYAGGRGAGFFGGSGSAAGGYSSSTGITPALQRHLQVLGLSVEGSLPSQDVVRGAYRKLALQAHPDKGGSKSAFQELQNAYEAVLSAVG
eukprot:TRINITY_DN23812_c0_g1_i1.p1 TRINITY_DN23812_c0_g1~~TRINITY_DN23812_c0_g1_i1.p1  ORF type:complete len:539 (+),score=104.27 TRINITY_DN23812_c0_g1_i1:70-1686(+)